MQSEFIIIARSSSIDNGSNLMSIFEIIDEIQFMALPDSGKLPIPVGFQLICSLVRDDTDPTGAIDTKVRVVIINPEGKKNQGDVVPVRFEDHHLRNRIRIGINIMVEKPGNYSIELHSDAGQIFASKKLLVKIDTPNGV